MAVKAPAPHNTGRDYGLQKPGVPVGVHSKVKKKGRVGPVGSPGLGYTCIT